MGGFGTLSAIGGAGEDFGKGAVANAAVQHSNLMDTLAAQARSRQVDTEAAAQKATAAYQQGQLTNDAALRAQAQQQFELSGYKDFGINQKLNPDGSSAGYERVYHNIITGKEVRLPEMPDNVPESKYAAYQMLLSRKGDDGQPIFTSQQAKDAVWPESKGDVDVSAFRNYDDYAKQKYPNDPKKADALATDLRQEHMRNKMALAGQWGFPPSPYNMGPGGFTPDPKKVAAYKAQLEDPNSPTKLTDIPNTGVDLGVRDAVAEQNPDNKFKLSPPERLAIRQRRDLISATIDAVNRLQSNADLLTPIGNASLMQLMQDPDSNIKALVARGWLSALSSPKDANRLAATAGDLRTLANNINVITLPMNAAAYRGQETFQARQSALGQRLADPGLNAQVLKNTKGMLQDMLDSSNEALGAGPKQQAAPSTASPGVMKALSADPPGGPYELTASDGKTKSYWMKNADGSIVATVAATGAK